MDDDWRARAHAESLMDLRRYTEAEAAFRDVLARTPDSVPALLGLGRALHQQQRDEAAEGVVRRAIGHAPDDARAHRLMSVLRHAQDDPNGAGRSAQRALQLDPHAYQSHYVYAQAMLMDPDRRFVAMQAAERAVALAPGDPDAHTLLGMCLAEMGMHRKAVRAYRTALAIAPDHTFAQNNLAVAAYRRGRIGRAARLLRSAAAEAPQETVLHGNLEAVVLLLTLRMAAFLFTALQVTGTTVTMGLLDGVLRPLAGVCVLTATVLYVWSVLRRLPRGLLSPGRLWHALPRSGRVVVVVSAAFVLGIAGLAFAPRSDVIGPARAIALFGILGYPMILAAALAFLVPHETREER